MNNKNNFKNPNFMQALKNSLNGIKYVYSTQKNIVIQSIIAILAIILALCLKINYFEWLVLIVVIFLVLFAEFINTSIETVTDMITEEYNEKAKITKDVAAAAVTIVSILSVIIGIIIFLPKIINIIINFI